MDTMMHLVFLVLGAAMMYAIIVRLLFHAAYREPTGAEFKRFLDLCRKGQRLEGGKPLGWVDELLHRANFGRTEFRQAVEMFRRRTEWCHDEQKVFSGQATALGLLCTLISLTTAASGNLDLVVVIAMAVKNSVYGLLIAIPGSLFYSLLQRRVDRFLDQVDGVLMALDTATELPTAVRIPVESSSLAQHPVVPPARRQRKPQEAFQQAGKAKRDVPPMHAVASERRPAFEVWEDSDMIGAADSLRENVVDLDADTDRKEVRYG
jgi:hypothetical protein